jgi:hypothetical protein
MRVPPPKSTMGKIKEAGALTKAGVQTLGLVAQRLWQKPRTHRSRINAARRDAGIWWSTEQDI